MTYVTSVRPSRIDLHAITLMLLALLLPTWGCGDGAMPVGEGVQARIHPSAEQPRYWQMGDEPVMLLGGSREDNLFQIDDVEDHLDLLESAGGNYVRNTMSSRDSGDVWPFARLESGLYDLERPSEGYFDRLSHLLKAAHERGVVVQIELWDRFDYAREPWLANPFRPANNINYTIEESGLRNEYPAHPGSNDNPFFRTVPGENDHALILRYQRAHVDRILDLTLPYPNVLYTMDNETNGIESWGAYWARYIQEAADRAGVDVYTTEMWDAWDLRDEQHRRTLDHPDLYAFADVSQNNHNTGQEHWDNLQWVRSYIEADPRPLNTVKTYGADGGPYGSSRDGTERFWRNVVGGAASARFHRPPSGLGLSPLAQAHLTSARLFVDAFDLFRAQPDVDHVRLTDRNANEAYLSHIPGDQSAVYFTDGGSVGLDLSGETGTYAVRWLDVEGRRWQPANDVEAGGVIRLDAPPDGHWVALLERL